MFNCMKKQFFSKLLMAAMLVTAVGSFQSCKDYDGDIAKIEQNASVLQGQVNSLQDALNTAKSELAAAQAAADQAVKAAEEAKQSGADANALAKEAKEAMDNLAKVASLQETVANLEAAIADVKAIAEGKVDQKTLDSEIAKVAGRIDAIDTNLNQLTEGIAAVATLKGEVKEAIEAIEALQADMASQMAAVASFKKEVAEKLAFMDEESIMTMLQEKLAEAEASVSDLQERISQIDANANSISEIKATLEGMQERINETAGKLDNVNPNIGTLNVFVDNILTSMVLKPTLYYGGIEAVEAIHGEYQPIGFSIYYADDEYNADRANDVNAHQDPSQTNAAYAATSTNAWDITYEYAPKNDLVYKYPVVDAYYHVNPKHLTRAEIGDIALNTEDRHYVNTTNTRAERNSLDISLDVCGPQVYTVENGLLHAYFTNSADMWHRVEQYAHTVTVVSLEATAPTAEGTRTVTSDWGAIARVHQNTYRIADNDAYITHYETYPHIYKPEDTDCGLMDTQQYTWTEQHVSSDDATREDKYNRDIVHVYRQAREAIVNEYTHLLPWDGTKEWVDLDEVIEVHALHHYYDANGDDFDFPVDLAKLGFKRKYTVVNYQYPATMGVNINGTEESQHAHIEDGHLLKANFITNGKRDITKVSRTSIGREPLVMIEIIDTLDQMEWNPDHMNWEAVDQESNPRNNLVAVGFIKFKISDYADPINLVVTPDMQGQHMYASCAGDTILTNWYEVEEQILDAIKKNGQSISKSEFESNYVLRGQNGEDAPFREITSATGYINGQVYVPYTRKTQIIGTRQNWVSSVDLSRSENWVLPQVVLNTDITAYDDSRPNVEQRFVDPDRYGNVLYTTYDWLHRETNLIGVTFTAEQMMQQLVKRDHEGCYLDSLGNKVTFLSEADFYPYVDTKVAAKLVDPNHNGWPEVTLQFQVRVHLNKATMIRPSRLSGNGNWYAVSGKYTNADANKNNAFVNANVDAFNNGTPGTNAPIYDVRRFVLNLQQCLKGQKWFASTSNYTNAFDFWYTELTGERAAERIGIQKAKLGRLHGDLYFYTKNWLGDIEEGTPYWHDATRWMPGTKGTPTIKDDKFYADQYIIKVCYTKNPLDTVVWAQEAAPKQHIGKLGKYLFAYKYVEDHASYIDKNDQKTGDPSINPEALVQNYTHYDMANGELIAWIDNYDTHQVDFNPNMRYPYANCDIDGFLNENVNVHYNFNSHFAQDLLNRAGRYAESNSGTQDGYSKATDNPFSVHCHLNLFEGDCLPAVNPIYSETYQGQDYIVRQDEVANYVTEMSELHTAGQTYYVTNSQAGLAPSNEYHYFWHRPAGVPVMLNNPDFVVRFERPISVEFQTPWQTAAINAVEDAVAGAATFTITYTNLFRNQTGSPYSRVFPMDWRNYTQVANQTAWIQYYQGKQVTGTFNDAVNDGMTDWNRAPWKRNVPYGLGYLNGFKYMDEDRSSWDRGSSDLFFNWNGGWFYQPNTSETYADTWNSMNVVPQVDHMLTNYGGIEGFWSSNASQVNMQITHQTDPNTGNIVSTTFRYLNDDVNRGPFDIIIPVTVKYAWGDITTTGKWESTNNIQRTNDRYFHNANMNYIKVHFGPTIAN